MQTPIAQRAALAFILAVGGWLRFYHLETPSMWPDEMLVALMGTFPTPYIAKWAMALEVHPPTYHYFIKLVEFCGLSDFTLRLPSALAGTASIWLVWRAGCLFFGMPTALFAAALMASNPLHVWLSRQVRPYALMVFFFLLAFINLGIYLRSGERRHLLKAMLANLPLLLTHYISILIVGTEGMVLVTAALVRLNRQRVSDVLAFAAGSFVSFLPVTPFFLAMLAKRQDMTAKAPWDAVFGRTVDYAAGLFNLFSHPALTWVLVAAWVAGVAAIILRGRFSRGWLAFCLAFMALPFGAILCQRYTTFYYSSHVSFMLPAVVLPAGYGLALLVRREALAPIGAALTALVLGTALFVHDHAKLYQEDSTIISWWRFGTFKNMARLLPEAVKATDQLVFADMLLPNSLNWYLRQFSTLNPVENPRLGSEGPAIVHFLSNGEFVGNLFASEAGIAKTGTITRRWKLDALNVVTMDVPRTPVHPVTSLPFALDVTGHPGDFFAKVHALEGLAVKPDWGGTLHPSRYDEPGWAEFVIENRLPGTPQNIILALSYANIGEGDEIALEYALDDGPVVRSPVSTGPDRKGFFSVKISPDTGYGKLRWRVSLTCRKRTPYGYGGSLQTVQLKLASAWICPRGNDGFCQQKIFESQVRMAQQSYLDVGFANPSSALKQEMILPERGLKVMEEGEPGWKVLTPDTQDKPVAIRIKVSSAQARTIFYPRVGGGSFVGVRVLEPGGPEPESFRLTGLHGEWTPIAAQYPLSLPSGQAREVEITLSGPWAQLWVYGGAALFSP